MQHALLTNAIATERRHELLAEGRAAGRREGPRTGLVPRLPRRRPARPGCGQPCFGPHAAS
jgi:hypothetical protein